MSEEYKNYDHQVTLKNLRPSVEYNATGMGVEMALMEQSVGYKNDSECKNCQLVWLLETKTTIKILTIRLSSCGRRSIELIDKCNFTTIIHFAMPESYRQTVDVRLLARTVGGNLLQQFSVPTTKTLVAALTQGCRAESRVTIECDSRNLR